MRKYPKHIVTMFLETIDLEQQIWQIQDDWYDEGYSVDQVDEMISNLPKSKELDLLECKVEEECKIYDAESGADREDDYDLEDCWEALYKQAHEEATEPW